MKIIDLKDGSRRVDLEATVIEKGEPKEITTRYGRTKIANATIEDDSGSITLVLWGDDTEKLEEGNKIRIENGYVREWSNSLQLSIGRYGRLTIL